MDSYIGVEHPFLNYDFVSAVVSSLLLLRVTKCHRLGSKAFAPIPSRDVVWLPMLVNVSMEFRRADSCAG